MAEPEIFNLWCSTSENPKPVQIEFIKRADHLAEVARLEQEVLHIADNANTLNDRLNAAQQEIEALKKEKE
jgi:hypothetical protein